MLRSAFLLVLACVCASAQPVWTDIMNATRYTTAASGTYWEFSALDLNGYRQVPKTNIASYSVMGVPRSNTGTAVAAGGNDPFCTVKPSYWTTKPPYYRNPQQRIQSYQALGIKGVGFFGTFEEGFLGTFATGSYLIQSVYFSEQQCYFGGREFGFWYDAYSGNVYAYWEINANCGASYCTGPTDANCTGCTSGVDIAHNVPIGSFLNAQYYFSMYPTGTASSCAFQVNVMTGAYVTQLNQSIPVTTDITSVDPAFCANVLGSSGETGYVTAGTVYGPSISSISTSNELILSRVFVGK